MRNNCFNEQLFVSMIFLHHSEPVGQRQTYTVELNYIDTSQTINQSVKIELVIKSNDFTLIYILKINVPYS